MGRRSREPSGTSPGSWWTVWGMARKNRGNVYRRQRQFARRAQSGPEKTAKGTNLLAFTSMGTGVRGGEPPADDGVLSPRLAVESPCARTVKVRAQLGPDGAHRQVGRWRDLPHELIHPNRFASDHRIAQNRDESTGRREHARHRCKGASKVRRPAFHGLAVGKPLEVSPGPELDRR